MKPGKSLYYRFGKRLFDPVLAVPGCIVMAPVLGLLALLVRWTLGRPVLFCQARPGFSGKPFTIYKFRTMTDKKDGAGKLLTDAERMTRLGRFLRKTSLDELPELFNVLKGDMSLVGPRPLLMQYLERYTKEQARRHEVKPGLTGWAQVNGRNAITWEEKFKLDVWYVDHMSFGLDLRIIFLTIWKILKREGINQPGQATVVYFQGAEDGGRCKCISRGHILNIKNRRRDPKYLAAETHAYFGPRQCGGLFWATSSISRKVAKRAKSSHYGGPFSAITYPLLEIIFHRVL